MLEKWRDEEKVFLHISNDELHTTGQNSSPASKQLTSSFDNGQQAVSAPHLRQIVSIKTTCNLR